MTVPNTTVPQPTPVVEHVLAWEALDSRGNPTVACEIRLEGGATGTAMAPAGASTGSHEAHELRDGGTRYGGLGVRAAVHNMRTALGPAVVGLAVEDQEEFDGTLRDLDGTPTLSRMGANAVLALSLAACRARADARGVPLWRSLLPGDGPVELPMPMVNILSGGAHAGRAVDIQDVLAVPLGATGVAEALEWVDRVRRATAEELRRRGHATALVADEGGYGPALASNREALDVVTTAVERSGLQPGRDVGLALDIAATQFFDPATGTYRLASEGRSVTAEEWAEELAGWVRAFPVVSVEDAMAEDDWSGWAEISALIGGHTQVVGDDLFATRLDRVQRAVSAGVGNAVLVKVNQVGTISDAYAVVGAARAAGYATVLSARSGETEEDWLADLAVGWATGQIKVGSLARSERTAKWNRLLRLEAELGTDARFAGRQALVGDAARAAR